MATPPRPSRVHLRGFASLSPEERRRLAQLGGRTAQATGAGHRWTSESARRAGRKGGLTTKTRRAPAGTAQDPEP